MYWILDIFRKLHIVYYKQKCKRNNFVDDTFCIIFISANFIILLMKTNLIFRKVFKSLRFKLIKSVLKNLKICV